jgi:class 3 adenylate cyclase
MRKYLLFVLFTTTIQNNAIAQLSKELYEQGVELRTENRKLKAIAKFEEALTAAENESDISMQMTIHVALAKLKDNVIQYKEALAHYRAFSMLYETQTQREKKTLIDSVNTLENEVLEGQVEIKENLNAIDSLTTEQLKSELAIRDLELVNQKNQIAARDAEYRKNILWLGIGMFAIIGAFLVRGYFRKRDTAITLSQKNDEIYKAKEESDKLLLNILPESVADELKLKGKTTTRLHPDTTVMFTDFKGFTHFSENHTPEELVAKIDFYFSHFDTIIAKYGIEKIKTIGDAYLAVSGIPEFNKDHLQRMLSAALEIRDFVHKSNEDSKGSGEALLEIRIGLHSGPLVAGVVGSKKFAYDVWGDTVNIAARMEQSGEADEINVSENVYQLAKEGFVFTYRGEIEAKNKGKMKMYYLVSPK